MPELRPEIRAFYEAGQEAGRLSDGRLAGPLEFERTMELLERFLPDGSVDVLDVGGGPGRYAEWLHGRGHRVVLVDPVPLHVDQALARSLTAEIGDARALTQPDASFDVVLLMGPLYHLTDEADRQRALSEAGRVLRPGGVLIATAISRFAALLDLLLRLDRLHEPGVFEVVEGAVRTGAFHGHEVGMFTTAYFHRPRELRDEISAAGFSDVRVVSIEGPGFLSSNFDERWNDPARREALLATARLVETEPDLLGAASHLLAAAVKPGRPSG